MRLLIAEDDAKLRKSIVHIFEKNRFVVDSVGNGAEALDYALTGNYDGLILDIMMPGLDGLSLLKEIRLVNINTPVMFLTAKTEVYQRVEGLDAGADDYLPKPFATAELLARVRAMLRRKNNYTPDLLTFQTLTLNRSTYELSCGDMVQSLSAKEFQIMEMFIQRPNFIIQTEHFLSHIWGWESDVDTSVVWVHISNLRKKFRLLHAPVEIRFIRGAGYVLEESS